MSRDMNYDQGNFNGMPPFIMLILSGITMLFTKAFVIFASIYTWHVPPFIMECFQMIAWVGISITGLVAGLNYLGVKTPNPFKRKKK